MRRTTILTTTFLLALAGVAQAQDPSISATLTPSTPKAGIDVRPDGQRRRAGGLGRAARGARARPAARLRARQDRRRAGAAPARPQPAAPARRRARSARAPRSCTRAASSPPTCPSRSPSSSASRSSPATSRASCCASTSPARREALRARLLKLATGPFGYALQVDGLRRNRAGAARRDARAAQPDADIGAKRRVTRPSPSACA